MSVLGVRISDELQERLSEVAKATRRSKSQITKMAIESYLDEVEFFLEADRRYRDISDEVVSYDRFKEDFHLS